MKWIQTQVEKSDRRYVSSNFFCHHSWIFSNPNYRFSNYSMSAPHTIPWSAQKSSWLMLRESKVVLLSSPLMVSSIVQKEVGKGHIVEDYTIASVGWYLCWTTKQNLHKSQAFVVQIPLPVVAETEDRLIIFGIASCKNGQLPMWCLGNPPGEHNISISLAGETPRMKIAGI